MSIAQLGRELPQFPMIPMDFAVCYSGEALPFDNAFERLNDLEYDYKKIGRGRPWYNSRLTENSDVPTDKAVSMVNSNILGLLHEAFLDVGQ